MRSITEKAIQAFNNNVKFNSSNTSVRIEDGKTNLYLHNNLIATKSNGVLEITNAGWQTNTTKERLNGLPGVSISQKNWKWYLNGKEWNGELVKVANF